MRSFDYVSLKSRTWGSEIIGYIAAIHEAKGKQEMFLRQRPQELDRLVEIAKIQSTEASNDIEGIRTTNTRLKQLLSERAMPKTRDEQEIAGYRDVLKLIHESYADIPITSNYILQLHKILYNASQKSIGGHYKNVQNYISATDESGKSYALFTPLSPFETPIAMDDICREYRMAIAEREVDPLILIPIFVHDFLCIHPFLDGNGRMSRLLTTLLLYQSGFMVGKYVSLEAKIAKNKDLYYDSLAAAQVGWHEGNDDPTPFIRYLLGVIVASYRDFEERMELFDGKMPALELVRRAVMSKVGRFTKTDIVGLCGSLSASSVEVALRKLVDSGELIRLGAGRSTEYVRRE